jgi:hypothetical protein
MMQEAIGRMKEGVKEGKKGEREENEMNFENNST